MEKVQGIVMELDGGKAVIMTPRGEFKKVPLRGSLPQIGEEISVDLPAVTKIPAFRGFFAAVAAALLLLLVSPAILGNFNQTSPAAAYITVDINPSLELAINVNQEVIDIKAFNQDAENLLTDLKIKGLEVNQALKVIARQAISLGYIVPQKENNVILSFAPAPKAKEKITDHLALETSMQKALEETLESNQVLAVVTTLEVDPVIRDEAQKSGLSAGQFAIMMKAQEAGLDLTPDDFKGTTVALALKEAGLDMVSVIGATYNEPIKIRLVERSQVGSEIALKGKDQESPETTEVRLEDTAASEIQADKGTLPPEKPKKEKKLVMTIKPLKPLTPEKTKPANIPGAVYSAPIQVEPDPDPELDVEIPEVLFPAPNFPISPLNPLKPQSNPQ